MKNSTTVQAEFMQDLKALLRKHGAELTVSDDDKAYGMHLGVCEIFIDSRLDHDGERISDSAHFNLDTWMDGSEED